MRLLALSVTLLSGLVAGCGSDDEPAQPPVERKEESADKLPKLERGYEEFVNADAGIAFGRPPGWDARARGTTTRLTAPDELVSATISVDRTGEALAGDPGDAATQTAEALGGYRKPLEPGKPKRFPSPYEAAVVEAKGTSEAGVEQTARVVVLERKGVAVVTAVVAENAERAAAKAEAKQALESIETLRTRPPS